MTSPNDQSGRVYCYGYRYREIYLPKLTEIKDGATIGPTVAVDHDEEKRPVVQVSLGCHVSGAALPHACPQDVNTMKAGCRKRYATKPPPAKRKDMLELRKFVRKWLRKNLVPLSSDTDVTVEAWLERCPYPAYRKKELLELFQSVLDPKDPRYLKVKSFMKDETYTDYKHARGINSRHDYFKCLVGPIFKAIEDVVYKHPSFIKHVPVKDRAQYIFDMLFVPGSKYIATDYTAFEALFTKELMSSCEFELYSYMTQFLPCHDEFMTLCRSVLAGKNECYFKNFKVTVPATRMSGEMCTSLGNGFANLMIMLYVLESEGCTDVDGVVEGDDGLFRFKGPIPRPHRFTDLGLMIKMDVHDSLETASFCGLVFDLEDRNVITNPMEVLMSFGWTSRRYARSNRSTLQMLLRAKSLSLAYQYPGCPIIQSLARYGLRMTRGVQVKRILEGSGMNMWEREQLREAIKFGHVHKPVGVNTRLLVEKLYGIDVEAQIAIEQYLDSLEEIKPLELPQISHLFPTSWTDYFEKYSSCQSPSSDHLEYPAPKWPLIYDLEWDEGDRKN